MRSEYYGEAGDVIDTKYIDSLSLKEKYGLIYNKISLFHPKILVVKKPFAYGDMHCRTYILKRMQELKAAGVSILLLTGYLTDCVYISDHIGIVKDGSFFRTVRATGVRDHQQTFLIDVCIILKNVYPILKSVPLLIPPVLL